MNSTIKITKLCPKCGLHRSNALLNVTRGDPTASNLLLSCPECKEWLLKKGVYQDWWSEKKNISSPVDTALAGIRELLQDQLHRTSGYVFKPDYHTGVKETISGIRAILEALVEDVRANLDTERKVRI